MGLVSFSAVREGLQTQLETILGLRVYAIVPDSIATPAAVVAPGPVTFLTFDSSMTRGSDDLVFVVALFVSRQWDRTSQDTLDAYLAGEGSSSVKQAIEADPTLSGSCMSVAVEQARNYGQLIYNGIEFYGCEFLVSVYC